MANKMQGGAKSCAVSFNVVPLVDVIMLLIFFFVLTTEIASKSIASMDLPKPTVSMAQAEKKPGKGGGGSASETGNKIIVNVVSKAPTGLRTGRMIQEATEGHLMIDGDEIDITDSGALERRINQRRTAAAQNPDWKRDDFLVEVRADKDVYWQYVAPVMAAASACGVKNVTLTALTDDARAAKPEGAL